MVDRKLLRLALSVFLIAATTFLQPVAAVAGEIPDTSTDTTIPVGSYIIDMGVQPQTKENALKPYGLVYELMIVHRIPVMWVINDAKVKDGVDFSYNGKDYKGGAFIVSAAFAADAAPVIAAWKAAHPTMVVDGPTTAEFQAPVFETLTNWPNAILDAQNGSIAQGYFVNAGIPQTATAPDGSTKIAYQFKTPDQLTTCDDIYVMPHADPEWDTHSSLVAFNESGGFIWAACHAVTVLENLADPSDPNPDPEMNFLSTAGLLDFDDHKDGSPPYTYATAQGGDPILQFLGAIDNATTNGSEQIFLPSATSAWRPTSKVLVWDPDQEDLISQGGVSPGEAAVLVYGRGFGDPNNGLVMYEGGHSHNKGSADDVAAQRAFFNLQLTTGIDRGITVDVTIPTSVANGDTVPVSAEVSGGHPAYEWQWASTCGGSFAQPTGAMNDPGTVSTTFTAPSGASECVVRLIVDDTCSRFAFDAEGFEVAELADLSLTKDDGLTAIGAGSDIVHTLTVTNAGPGVATGTLTIDELPAGATFLSAAPSQGSCTFDGTDVNCELGDIPVGGTATVDITSHIAASYTGTMTNTASVSSDQADPDPSNNSASDSTEVGVNGLRIDVVPTPSVIDVTQTPVDVTYTYTVTNVGPNVLTSVAVSDDVGAGVTPIESSPGVNVGDTDGDGALDPGEEWLFECTTPISVDTDNVATATATDPVIGPVAATDTGHVEVIAPDLDFTKAPDGGQHPDGGDVVFEITVTNSGDVPLFAVKVSDAQAPACERYLGNMAPGASISYSCSISPAPASGTNGVNTAVVTALDEGGATLTRSDAAAYTVIDRALGITKVPVDCATEAPLTNVEAYPGDTVCYRIVVQNTGSTAQTDVTLSDVLPDGLSPVSAEVTAPVELISDDFDEDLTNKDFYTSGLTEYNDDDKADAGQVKITDHTVGACDQVTEDCALKLDKDGRGVQWQTNLATVATVDIAFEWNIHKNDSVADSWSVACWTGSAWTALQTYAIPNMATMPTVPGPVNPVSLSLALPAGCQIAGGAVGFITAATNRGNHEVILDDLAITLRSGSGSTVASLSDSFENWNQDPWNSGWLEYGDDGKKTGSAVRSRTPGDFGDCDTPGDCAVGIDDNSRGIYWPADYSAQNQCSIGFDWRAYTTDGDGNETISVGGINSSGTWVQVAAIPSSTVTGFVSHSVTVDRATYPSLFHAAGGLGAISGSLLDGADRILLDNMAVSCTDSYSLGAGAFPTLITAGDAVELAPGGSMEVLVTVTVDTPSDPVAEAYPRQLVNVASTTSTEQSTPSRATATVQRVVAAIALLKTAGTTMISPGDSVTYTFAVANPGNEPLENVAVTDSGIAGCSPAYVSGDTDSDGKLDVTETWTYTCSAVVPTSGPTFVNTATASGDPTTAGSGEATVVSDTDQATVEVVFSGIAVTKSASRVYARPGSSVTYTYDVSLEPGTNEPLTGVFVTDDKCAPVTGPVSGDDGDQVLEDGETWQFACATTLAATTTNTATATGTDRTGVDVTATDDATVTVINPGIGLVKTASPETLAISGTVDYSITVTNTGDDPLSSIAVSDTQCSPLAGPTGDNGNGVLDPAESWGYTCSRTISADTTNVATVSAIDSLGKTWTASDDAFVDVNYPGISLSKTADSSVVVPGDTVTYTYSAYNDGDTPFDTVTVTDDKCAPVTGPAGDDGNGTLDVGEAWLYTCTATLAATTTNTGTVTATSVNGTVVVTDTARVRIVDPVLTLTKSASAALVSYGDPVDYTFEVTNATACAGDTTCEVDHELTIVAVTDDHCSTAPAYVSGDTGADGVMEVGETWTFACTEPVYLPTTNTASATAVDVLDNTVTSPDATAFVDVDNVPPTAVDDAATTDEDTPVTVDVVANDTDYDGSPDPTSVTVTSGPANGSTSVDAVTGEITYTPDPEFSGTDTFSYEVCDDGTPTLCDTAEVTITVNPVNDPPAAADDADTTPEETPVTVDVVANDTDIDGTVDPTSVVVVTAPTNGSTSVDPVTGEITYTPDTDFTGTDTFAYQVCDDGTPALCDTATVTIDVTEVNDAPVANDDAASTPEDAPVTVDVVANDTDIDGAVDPTTVTVTSGPSNGSVSVDPVTGEVTYTPDANFNGTDSFTYEVCDDGTPSLCDTATVTFDVAGVNDPPGATDDAATTDEDTPVTIDVTANDLDTDGSIDPTSVTVTSGPSNGSVSVDPVTGEVTYTPDANFNGADSFTYEVCDDGTPTLCDTAVVTVDVLSVNDPPVAGDDSATTPEDTPVTVDVVANDTDVDGTVDPTSVIIITSPANGSVSVDPVTGEITYTPGADFNGTDIFVYEVCDDGSPVLCDTAVVTIDVTPVNDPPVANDDSATTDEDAPVTVDVVANDTDVDGNLDPPSVTITSGPGNGSVSVDPVTGEVTYTPDADFNGTDSFTYEVCDDGAPVLCDTATVTVDVVSVNDAPVANDDAATTGEDTPVTVDVTANDTDVDGVVDPTTVTVTSGPANGSMSVDPVTGDITYTPDADFNGTDTFTYEVCDDANPALCDTATVTIDVTPVNDAPVANDDAATTDEDTPVTVDVAANDTDVDGTIDLASVVVVSAPANGSTSVDPVTGETTYTPDPDFNGTDSFTYEVCDTGAPVLCDTAVVTIDVSPVIDPPVANDDAATTDEDTPVTVDVLANDSDVDGNLDASTVTVTSGPGNGSVAVDPVTGEITYTPDADFNGTDSFTYEVCDTGTPVLCDAATVTVNVGLVNDAPVANDDNATTDEDTAVTVDVTANDTDLDGVIDPTTVTVTSGPANGSTSVDPVTGDITYTPDPNFNGTDSFTYEVCDTGIPVLCDTATVTVGIGVVNDPPVANDDAATTDEDSPVTVDVVANDTDLDGVVDPTTVTITSGPGNGSVSVGPVTGEVTYTPDADFNGTDSFTYEVCDDGAPVLCDTATVTVDIAPVNDAPVASDDAATTGEDTPVVVDVTANDTDVDGVVDPTTVTVTSGPGNGSVVVDPVTGEVTYTPDADFNGTDSFTYEVCDDGSPVLCDTAVVTIDVTPVNDGPVATDDAATSDEDAAVRVDVVANDTDVDGNLDPTSVTITSGPGNGSVAVDPVTGEVTYTPDADFNGTDSFTYEVCDDGAPVLCNTAVVTIDVTPVNDAPVANDDSATTDEDTPVVVDGTANDSDVDGNLDATSVTVTSGPSNGSVAVDPVTGEITYTPDPDFNGTDSFTYEVCDTGAPVLCDTATVTIDVTPVNDPPVANDDSATTDEDTPITVDVTANDTDLDGVIDPTTVTVTSGPANGSVSVDPVTGEITYTPSSNFNGTDSFTYEVCDDGTPVLCDTAVVTIDVTPVNDPPIARDDFATTNEDTPVSINVLGNDTDVDGNLDPATVTVVTPPANGSVVVDPVTGAVTYTPDPFSNGSDSFTYEVCDTGLPVLCGTAVVLLDIDSENDPPVAIDDAVTTPEDTPVVIDVLGNDFDVDDLLDPSTVTIIAGPSDGSVAVDPVTAEVTYTPDADFNGSDSFTYEVCDDGAPVLCDTATVTIDVTPVNDPPVANDDSATTPEDTPVTVDVTANDTDLDGVIDVTSVVVVSAPANGSTSVDPVTGEVTYAPDADFNGSDSFTYEVCDDGASVLCDTAVVTVDVTPVNDPPVAIDDAVTTPEDTPVVIDVLGNDTDIDGVIDPTTVTVTSGPANGSTSVDPVMGEVTYTPDADFNGTDSFSYQVCDDGSPVLCDTATVTIDVTPVNDPPVANDDSATTSEDTPVTVDVTANDTDIDGAIDPTTDTVTSGPSNGSVSVDPVTGEITYTPSSNFNGTDSFTYQVCDDGAPVLCDTATVTIDVTPVNDPPVANDDAATTPEDTPVTADVVANDTDLDGVIDPTTVVVVSAPGNGSTSVDPVMGEVTYTPDADFNGTDSFSYQVCDDGSPALCDTATVTIDVTPVNDPPIANDDSATTSEDTPVTVDVTANDTDIDGAIDSTTVAVTSGPANGTVTVDPVTGEVTYTPDFDFNGTDTFDYEVCDDGTPVLCDTATVTIDIIPVDDPPVVLSGHVYIDQDRDGLRDIAEPGIAGVTVTVTGIDDRGAAVSEVTTTDGTGAYSFTLARPGTYTITETQPAAYFDGTESAGSLGGTVGNDVISAIAADAGDAGTGYDFGELDPGIVTGSVYVDADHDGVRDMSEVGIPGVDVVLFGVDDLGTIVVGVATTDANGHFSYSGLRAGTYELTADQPAGYLDGIDTAGSAGGDATTVNDQISGIVIDFGEVSLDNTFGELAPATLSGASFVDADNDGVRDAGETGISGVTVTLTGTNDLGGAVSLSTITNATGGYSFTNLRPGDYTVAGTQPGGYLDGKDAAGTLGGTVGNDTVSDITVASGDAGAGYVFGELIGASLAGMVFDDVDGDGMRDAGEPGIGGVTVVFTGANDLGVPVSLTTSTAADGAWSFTGLRPGTYAVSAAQPVGYLDGDETAGSLGGSAGNDAITNILLGSDDAGTGYLFAEIRPASLAGTVFEDADADGTFDAGELGIDGADVTLSGIDDRGNPVVAAVTTGAGGSYGFTNLRPGTYTITESQPPAYLDGQDTVGSLGGTLGPDEVSAIPVAPGDAGTGYDFGEVTTTSISGSVIDDLDNDGIRDPADPGIPGATITLTGTDDLGDPVSLTTTTGPFGRYGFTALRPGTYTISETQPAGYFDGRDTAGPLGGTAGNDIITSIVLGSGQSATGNVFGELTPSSLAGSVFADTDGDGVFDATESGIAGVTVTLTGTNDLGAAVALATTTAAGGGYSFGNLRPGTYVIAETQPAGYFDGADTVGTQGGTVTANDQITVALAPSTSGTGNNFAELIGASVGNFVWLDVNDDGIQDPGEGINGVTVRLYAANGTTLLASTTTVGGGLYSFAGLEPFKDYVVEVVAPAGASFTTLPGTTEANDSDVDAAGRVTVTPVSGPNRDLADAGIEPASLDGIVWLDVDGDGALDATETSIAGVTVELRDDLGSLVATTTTDAAGGYALAGLMPGDYEVTVVYPGASFAPLGGDSDVDPVSGTAAPTLTSGRTSDGGDAGVQPAVIGDLVWLDRNGDGARNAGEPGLPGVEVTLYDAAGSAVATTTTSAAGTHTFRVAPDDYEVVVTAPAGGAFTAAGAAGEAVDSDVDPTGSTGLLTYASGSHVDLADAGVLPADIAGTVWIDLDGNGLNDDATPLAGVTVELYAADGTLLATTTTAADGGYAFTGLVPADYTVVVIPPKDAPFTVLGGDSDVDPATGAADVTAATSATVDAGILPGYVHGALWLDLDGDGIRNAGEPGAGGISVTLVDDLGAVVATTTTSGDGSYEFGPLTPGDYEIVVDETGLPAGTTQTADPDGLRDGSTAITVALGGLLGDLDFGYRPPATVAGIVFEDLDGDGAYDAGEPGLGGIDLIVTDADGTMTVVATAADGSYSAAVVPGATTIAVDPAIVPPGAQLTTANASQAVTAVWDGVTAASPIGYQLVSDVSGVVWNDADGDGVRDAGEAGIAGVTEDLYDAAGALVASVTTAADGSYVFRDVRTGAYVVAVDTTTLPPGADVQTSSPDGGDDAAVSVTVTAGADVTGLDFGYRADASISGIVWEDLDRDGIRDLGEPGLAGVDVTVTWFGPDGRSGGGDDETFTVTTAADGSYVVPGLQPGSYAVRVDDASLPAGIESSACPAVATAACDDTIVELGAGQALGDVDFGFAPVVDLEVIISSDVSVVAPGDQVTFTVTVVNNGPRDEIGPIELVLSLGDGLSFLYGGAAGWTYEIVGDEVVFTYDGGLVVGDELTFTFEAFVVRTDADLSVTAFVTGFGRDIDLSNNTRTTSIGMLPFTGLPTDTLAPIGLLMLLIGSLLLVITRRRREDEAEA